MNYLEPINAQIHAMTVGFFSVLPNLGLALIVLLAAWIVSRFAVGIAHRLTGRTELRTDLKALVETVVRLAIWIVGLLLAAAVVVPGFTPASLIAGLGIGALAIGFAFQDIFENFLAGVLIMLRDKMSIGDVIEIEGTIGRVERITLRETHVRSLSNELTIMPNSMLFKNPVKILTDAHARRDEIVVGVDYDTDLDAVRGVIVKALAGIEGLMPDREVGVFARAFGANSVEFLVQWWADTSASKDMREVRNRVMLSIKRELDAAGIELPCTYVTSAAG